MFIQNAFKSYPSIYFELFVNCTHFIYRLGFIFILCVIRDSCFVRNFVRSSSVCAISKKFNTNGSTGFEIILSTVTCLEKAQNIASQSSSFEIQVNYMSNLNSYFNIQAGNVNSSQKSKVLNLTPYNFQSSILIVIFAALYELFTS